MADETKTVTVAVAGFPYRAKLVDSDGTQKVGGDGNPRVYWAFAQRGDTVELFDPADISRGEKNGYFLKPGEELPNAGQLEVSIDDIGMLTDEQLHDLFREKPPTGKAILAAVGEDASLAQRALQAEQESDHEPRKSVVASLSKIIGSAS